MSSQAASCRLNDPACLRQALYWKHRQFVHDRWDEEARHCIRQDQCLLVAQHRNSTIKRPTWCNLETYRCQDHLHPHMGFTFLQVGLIINAENTPEIDSMEFWRKFGTLYRGQALEMSHLCVTKRIGTCLATCVQPGHFTLETKGLNLARKKHHLGTFPCDCTPRCLDNGDHILVDGVWTTPPEKTTTNLEKVTGPRLYWFNNLSRPVTPEDVGFLCLRPRPCDSCALLKKKCFSKKDHCPECQEKNLPWVRAVDKTVTQLWAEFRSWKSTMGVPGYSRGPEHIDTIRHFLCEVCGIQSRSFQGRREL